MLLDVMLKLLLPEPVRIVAVPELSVEDTLDKVPLVGLTTTEDDVAL